MSERILAVIPCLNEEKHIAVLVEQLAAISKDLSMHIVIADGGSTDRTPQIAHELAKKYEGVTYLNNPKRIQAAAVNLAVQTSGEDAEFLIRIDAHADYPKDYCQVLIAEAEKNGADSVVVAMQTSGSNDFQHAVAAAQNSILGNGGSAHRMIGRDGAWVDHGHHALMRIDAFHKIGGYDESFSHNEDAELDRRLLQAGCRIWLTGKTYLTYYPRSSPWPLFKQYMQHGYGRAQTILKHRNMPKPRQLAPAAVLPALILALFSASWTALPFLFWLVFCLGYGVLLAMRADNMKLALAGPAAMIMHLGWSVGFWQAISQHLWKNVRDY